MIAALLYLALLAAVVVCFVLYYFAQYRMACRLRDQHPRQWQIIAGSNLFSTWLRLQRALRGTRPPLPQLLEDAELGRWYRIWRSSLWLAWIGLLAALAVQWLATHR